MVRRVCLLFVILMAGFNAVSAQSHNAVPVTEEDLYRLLEAAEIRDLITRLPGARPYPRSLIVKALRELDVNREGLSREEKRILDDYYARFVAFKDKPFLQDADVRIKSENFPARFGLDLFLSFNMDLANPSAWSTMNWFGIYAHGDLGKNVSYGVDLDLGLFQVDANVPQSWEPFTYTKQWDGGIHPLNAPQSFVQMPLTLAGGYAFYPELAASFWDSKVYMRFARQRNDWGIGETSLVLDDQARPFLAFDLTAQPWRWITLSTKVGTLEYGETFENSANYDIKNTSRTQQNMYAVLQLEIAPTKWLYLSIFDAGVYLKRPEQGYMFPLMSQFLNQNNVGDFDNLMFGGTLGLTWPGIFRTWFSLYLDEIRPTAGDFFGSFHNMYSYQAGIKAPIPGIPWSMLAFQYTKVEPFTYTHYVVDDSPWYNGLEMETGYLNNGENIALGIPPNSDEFLLQLTTQPAKGWSALGKFRLLRHGFGDNANDGGHNGGSLDSWGGTPFTPDTDPDGAYGRGPTKDFLKDGTYRWYFIFTLGGELDLRLFKFPAKVGLTNSFVYSYVTDYFTNGNFKPDPTYGDLIQNVLAITFKLYPW